MDDDKAKQSAGSYHTWYETDDREEDAGMVAAAAIMAADVSDYSDDNSREAGRADNVGDTDASDTNDTGVETDAGTPVDDTNATTSGTDTESTSPGGKAGNSSGERTRPTAARMSRWSVTKVSGPSNRQPTWPD